MTPENEMLEKIWELENQLAQKDQEIQALHAKLFEKMDRVRP